MCGYGELCNTGSFKGNPDEVKEETSKGLVNGKTQPAGHTTAQHVHTKGKAAAFRRNYE